MQIMTMAMTDSLLTISFLGQFHKYTNSFYKEFHHLMTHRLLRIRKKCAVNVTLTGTDSFLRHGNNDT